jgi:aryl-alcohol dehydrogenase-like predicted oxidoreductase
MGAAGVAMAAAKIGLSMPEKAGEMPKRKLGKMDWNAGVLAFGTAELPVGDADLTDRMLKTALNLGINYMDTAPSYQGFACEIAIGRAIHGRRKEYFLATKTLARDKVGAIAEVDASLKRLQTDHIDLLQIHSVNNMQNLDAALSEGGAVHGLEEAKKAGKIRHIGITGHTRPEVILEALKRYKFDSILVPVSAADFHVNDFAEKVIPKAKEMGISIAGMKSLKGWQNGGSRSLTATQLLHYAMSLPVCALTCGMTTLEQVKSNVEAARSFKSLSDSDLAALRSTAKQWATTQNLWWKRT